MIGGEECQSVEGTTQGDLAAIVIYAIAIIPVILMVVEISLQGNCNTFTAVYVDDLTAAGSFDQLRDGGMNYVDFVQNFIIVKEVFPSQQCTLMIWLLLDYLTTKKCWDELCRLGPRFYFPEGSKSWLVISKNAEEHVESIFKHTNIMITTEDRTHLGTIIRTTDNRQNYMKEKIGQCITESRMLCKIVWYKPQAVYSFSITGFKRKPTYIMQTIPNIKPN